MMISILFLYILNTIKSNRFVHFSIVLDINIYYIIKIMVQLILLYYEKINGLRVELCLKK